MAIKNALSVATSLKIIKDSYDTVNGLTFLYDPNWTSSSDNLQTLPFAFFHILEIEELTENKISEKRVILYENSETVTSAGVPVTPSLVNVVADNVVNIPTKYKIQCLVPFKATTRLIKALTSTIQNFNSFASETGSSFERGLSILLKVLSSIFAAAEYATDILLKVSNPTSIAGVSDFNKNSIKAMAESRSRLQMKVWTGWEYKYVLIESVAFTKVGIEDDYYRCTMTVRELPIMTVDNMRISLRKKPDTRSQVVLNKAAKAFEKMFLVGRE